MTRLKAPLHDTDTPRDLEAEAAFAVLLADADTRVAAESPRTEVHADHSGTRFRARCSCGWRAETWYGRRGTALREAGAHAQLEHAPPRPEDPR